MAAPATVEEFLDLVRKSGVLDDKRLDAYLQKNRARLSADPIKAAEILLQDGLITNFQKENIIAGKWRRFFIGKYKVLEKLGSGGMGQVYLCEHILMRRRVAVKVLPTAKAKDSSALERFYLEARAVAALTHPNIVHAYDIDQNEDLHFLVMEYVDGANLQEIVKRTGPLNVSRACHYMRQSALALQHAHEANLVHRDVKPGNILVDRAGVVKVLDLGLARFFHTNEESLTEKYDENVLGTADYLSPEQALDSHAVDIRADIYSLGATFYYLLTGRAPFDSANVTQKLMMHQLREPKPIQEVRKDVPAGLAAIVQKMMAKNPDHRYSIPAEVADALEPFTQEPIGPPSEAELPRLSLAASGHHAVLESADSAVSSSKNFMPALQRSGSSSGFGSGQNPTGTSATGSARPSAAPLAMAAPPVARPAPPELPEVAPWEEFAHDTEDPSAKADTDPQSTRSSKSKKGQKSPRRKLVLVAALVFVLGVVPLVLLVGLGLALWVFYFSRPAPAPPTGPPKLEVSKDPLRKAPYSSIQLALRNAKVGSVIELCDAEYEENVDIERARAATDVTLQAAPGREVRWRSGKTNPKLPIIKFDRASDFKFKGKGITLDGTIDNTHRVENLMLIMSECPGLVVEDLQFKSFAQSAVLVINCTGTAEQPIKLVNLKTMTEKSEKPRAAIYFDAIPKMLPAKNDHIEVQGGVYQGLDPAKAILFNGDKVLTKNVRWPGR